MVSYGFYMFHPSTSTISQPFPNHLPASLHLPDVLAARRFDGNGTRALPGQPGQIVPGHAPGEQKPIDALHTLRVNIWLEFVYENL